MSEDQVYVQKLSGSTFSSRQYKVPVTNLFRILSDIKSKAYEWDKPNLSDPDDVNSIQFNLIFSQQN